MKTSPGYQVVLAALIGAAISLFTTWLNNSFHVKREQQQWYRNQLSQIYLKCIFLLNQVSNEIWLENIDVDKLRNILEDFDISLDANLPEVASKFKADYAIVPDNKVKLFQNYYTEIQEQLMLLLANQPQKDSCLSEADKFIAQSWERPCKFLEKLGQIKLSDDTYTARERISVKVYQTFPPLEKDAILGLTFSFIRFPSKATVNNLKKQIVNLMVNDSRLKNIS